MQPRNAVAAIVLTLMLDTAAAMEITGGTEADRAAFREIQRTWIESYLAGDMETLMSLHDEQTILMPRRQPTLRSIAEIRGFFEGRLGKYDIDFNDNPQELVINGDWAFLMGEFSLTGTPKDGGETFRDAGRYFVLYRKNADGDWKIYRDIDNVMPAPMQ